MRRVAALAFVACVAGGCSVQACEDDALQPSRSQYGLASYYADRFHGQKTASGQRFDNGAMVGAHPSLPLGAVVRVTNLANGRSARIRIVDRGPARGPRAKGVIIDVSRAAATQLGFLRAGRTRVRLDLLSGPDG